MTRQVNVYEAKTTLSALLTEVEAGEDVVIARHGRAVARLSAIGRRGATRVPGGWKGEVWMADDFDELDDQTLTDWYGPSEDGAVEDGAPQEHAR